VIPIPAEAAQFSRIAMPRTSSLSNRVEVAPNALGETTVALRVELADPARYRGLTTEWEDLLTRAAEPNVFMDPAMVEGAAAAAAPSSVTAILAWQESPTGTARQRLLGVWAIARARPRCGLPVRLLRAAPHDQMFLATPVIDAGWVEPVLAAMLDAIADAPGLPNILEIEIIGSGGPVIAGLERVLAARRSPPVLLWRAERPKLALPGDFQAHLAATLSSSTRKKLRQHRRRLAQAGEVTTPIYDGPAFATALEQFLRLEASGWKGRTGAALLHEPGTPAFVRTAMNGLARRGRASIATLEVDGRAIASQVLLRAGAAAFTWKIAYDENFHDYSPGMLLLEAYSARLMADATLRFADSCCWDTNNFMSSLWSDRQPVAGFVVDVRPGGSQLARVVAMADRTYRDARARASGLRYALRARERRHLRRQGAVSSSLS
jgi:CelD/BcsL family acetyltransferase involved in cellulose biosynthesis